MYLKIPEEFVSLILQDRFWVVHIPFVHMVKLQFLAQFPVDHLCPPSCALSYTLSVLICCICLCDWSFHLLSPHNLHLLFCCILSILALICCAAIRRDSVSLLRFHFLSHVHVFLCEMLLISRLKHSCFSSYFCFLVIVVLLVLMSLVLFLLAVISLPLCFSM